MKNLGIIIGIGSLFVWAYGKSQEMLSEYMGAIKQFTYKITGINNVRLSQGKVKFNLDFELTNPSQKNFNLSLGNSIQLTEIRFFNKQGAYLGVAKPNVSAISLPAQSKTQIKDVPSELPISEITNIYSLVSSGSPISQNLEIKASIRIAGKTFEI